MDISACIPCFNAEATLKRTIEGIRSQSRSVKEIVVIDDGSTDASVAIATDHADRVIRCSGNTGRGAARNRAIQETSSGFILFCDATLMLDATFVERAIQHLAQERVSAAFGFVTDPAPASFVDRWRQKHLFKTHSGLDYRASLATGGVLIKRSAVVEVGGFDDRLSAGEDRDLGERLLQAGWKVLSDPDLRILALRKDSLVELLRRYVRWNCAPGHVPSWREYLKLVRYHARLGFQDLAEADLLGAALTWFVPHYLFWSRRWQVEKPAPHSLETGSSVVRAT